MRIANNDKSFEKNIFVHRGMVLLAIIAGWASLQWTFLSSVDDQYTDVHFVAQNIGRAGMIVYALSIILLAPRYKVFWVLFNKPEKSKADERLKGLRKKVFERAYTMFATLSVSAFLLFNNGATSMQRMIVCFTVVTYVGLPILIAAWRKDS